MKAIIKKALPESSFIFKLYKKLYWRLLYYKRGVPLQWGYDLLHAYANSKSTVKFVQVGSNNGIDNDPISHFIREKNWQGVLVEPVPFLFNQLRDNYTGFHDKLFFENSAIANKNGKLKFYRLKDLPGLPQWYSQIGSFNEDVIRGHKSYIPDFDSLFIEDYVNAITFKGLMEKYDIKDLDLIHIDTEGFDYEVIKMIPFTDLDVDFIMFEHKHLSIKDHAAVTKLLRKNGYKVGKRDDVDTVAVKRSICKTISSAKV